MSERSTKRGRWTDWIEPDVPPPPPADAEPLDDTGKPRDPWTHLEPLFPVTSFTPFSACPHNGPIAEGSDFVCMVCHEAGKDGTPALPRDVKPLPPEYAPPEGEPSKNLNRKERRKRARAQRHAVAT